MVLEKINSPSDLKKLSIKELQVLCDEIRDLIIKTVSKTGGHLASSLGTVELITALHYVFDSPKDKIIFDVGHQAYAHKIITGRRDVFHTLRQYGGISGFINPQESEHDVYISGHSSTAVSAGLGFVVKRDLEGEDYKVISLIGDGSLSGGLCYEGLNNAGHMGKDFIVILNDNEMFISRPVGAIVNFLSKLFTLGTLKEAERKLDIFLKRRKYLGRFILRIARRFKFLLFPGMLFEEMGFSYLGPIDGHNLKLLIEIFSAVKEFRGPVVVHVVTKKGKGYKPAELEPTKFHGAMRFEIESGEFLKEKRNLTYTEVFSETIVKLAKTDEKIIAITAAMSEGTGLNKFANIYPDRFFDVGIAESHALVFAAGLAKNGLKPICAIYSTFLQRGFDQLIHDIALQNLPVVICIDRAGIVGDDGFTHQGIFDLSYLRLIPNFVVMSPKDENELKDMIYSAFKYACPVAIRYPRGEGFGVKIHDEFAFIPKGKAELLKEGNDVYIIAIGNMVYPAYEVAMKFDRIGKRIGVINIRFVKPLDIELLDRLKKQARIIITCEENTIIGGLGSAIKECMSDSGIKIYSIALPDKFVEHGSQSILRNLYNLSGERIYDVISKYL